MLAEQDLKKIKETEDAGKLVALVKQWRAACLTARASEERQWYKDLDMYQGRQFSEWSATHQQMVSLPAAESETRIAVNIIEPIVRTEMAKTSVNQPTVTVQPGSNDDGDKLAALAAEQVVKWFHETSEFQTAVFNPANYWRTVTGNGFIKTYFDHTVTDDAATAASRIAYKKRLKDGEQNGADPMTMGPPPTEVKGKIRSKHVTPFHLLVPDMEEVNLQDQEYLIHQYTMPFERARLAYEAFIPEDWAPKMITSTSILNVSHLGIQGGNSAAPDSVLILEAWVKPGVTKLLPLGGLIILVGDELVALANDGMPYTHAEFPFAHISAIDTGRFYRKSVVASCTPLQNETNRTFAQVIKHKNLAVKPQFFYDEGSLDPSMWRSKAGTLIPIRLGMKYPVAVVYPQMPSYVINLMDSVKATLDDISGQHQVSRAISPGADTAASALAILQETDDNFLSSAFASIRTCLRTVFRQYLTLAVQFWDEPRLIKIVGTDSPFDTRLLAGSNLTEGADVRVDADSILPVSKAGKRAQITEWIDKGIVPADIGLEAMEMGTLGKVFDRIKIDRDQAMRENVDMRNADVAVIQQHQQLQQQSIDMIAGDAENPGIGMPDVDPMSGTPAPMKPQPFFPIGWMDNDLVHSDEHRNFAKTQAYKDLAPEIQMEFQLHTEAHDERAMQQQAMQQAMAPAGEPGEESGAPGEDPAGAPTDQPPSQSAA
jgi:hypothetical protein